jgi:methyl-accepting chemotaxis protein
MRVSTRLFVLVASLAALLLVIGGFGVVGARQSNDALRSVYEDRTVPAVALGQIDALTFSSRMHVAQALANPLPDVIAFSVKEIAANQKLVADTWAQYRQSPLDGEAEALAADWEKAFKAYDEQGLKPAVTALIENDITTAQAAMVDKMTPLSLPVNRSIQALQHIQIAGAKTEYESAGSRYQQQLWGSVGLIGLGLLCAIAFGWSTVRSITRQLGGEPAQAQAVAERLGAGDFSVKLHSEAAPHSLMAQLGQMQLSLSQVVARVRQASEAVSGASVEIASGNHDLSSRTEQQAGAIQQTAASMEALGDAVQVNAQRAAQANALARTASEAAMQGGEVVANVVSTMQEINDSSRRIVDIISVIDGIAFQTNILALNAAVEAARAGEQGRGFAVVASEVRALAGRSAAAAKEVKSLIDASLERVARGNVLVADAGASMSEVVGSIRQVTGIMGEISAASSQQSTGVQQVGQAIALIDQTTQQNAAMVEEIAAAASSLQQEAQQLVESVAFFKLGPYSPALQAPTVLALR